MKKIFITLFVVGCLSTVCFAAEQVSAPVKDVKQSVVPVVEKKTEEVKTTEQAKTVKKVQKKGKKVNAKAKKNVKN